MIGKNRTFFYLAVLFISFASMAAVASSDGSDAQNVGSFDELKTAVEGGQTDITLTADITFTGTVTAPGAFTVNTGGHSMAVGGYLVLSGYKMTINVSSEAEMTAAVNTVNSITGTGDVVVSVTQDFYADVSSLAKNAAKFPFINSSLTSVTITGSHTITATGTNSNTGTSLLTITGTPQSTAYAVSGLTIDGQYEVYNPFVSYQSKNVTFSGITARYGLGSGINILGGSVATLAGATTVDNGWSGVRVSVFEGAEDNLTVKGVKGDYSFSEVFPIWKEHVTSTVDFEMDSYSVDVVIGPTTDQHYIVFYLSTQISGNMQLPPGYYQTATLQENTSWSVGMGETLTVGSGLTISVPQTQTFTNNGTIVADGAIEGTVTNNGNATFDVLNEDDMDEAVAAINDMAGNGNVTVTISESFSTVVSSVQENEGRFTFTNSSLSSVTISGSFTITATGSNSNQSTSVLLIDGTPQSTQYQVTGLTIDAARIIYNPFIAHQAKDVTFTNVAAKNGLGSGINSLGGAIATLNGVTTSGNGWSGIRVSMWRETVDSTINVGLGTYNISEAFPMWKERTSSTVNFVDIPSWHVVDVAISPTHQHYIQYFPTTDIKGVMEIPQGVTQVATLSEETWTVPSGKTLTVGDRLTVVVPQGQALTNDGTLNLGKDDQYTTTNQLKVSGGTVNGTGTLNIYSSGADGPNSPIIMTGGTFTGQNVNVEAAGASFIGVGPLTNDINISNNQFHMNGLDGQTKYGICINDFSGSADVSVTGNTFTSQSWINYCLSVGTGGSATISPDTVITYTGNITSGVHSYEWSVPGHEWEFDKADLRINTHGVTLGASSSPGIVNVVTNQTKIAISGGSNAVQGEMEFDYVGIRNEIGSLTVSDGANLMISKTGRLSSLGHLDVRGTLTNNGTMDLGCSSKAAAANLMTVSGGTVTKDEDGLGKINIYASGEGGAKSPIRMTAGTFEKQTLDINAKAAFIGIGPLDGAVGISGNTFNMKGQDGQTEYGISVDDFTGQAPVSVTGNTFTSESWISYCVQIGSGNGYTIPSGARFTVTDNVTDDVDSYEWSVDPTKADKAALRINANGAVIGSSGSASLNVVTNQKDIAISQGGSAANRLQEDMSLDYMGIRKGDGDLTVDAGVTLILPADKTARSYGHIEVLGVFDIEGTFHNGGSIELGPVGSLVINGHLYNMLTFVLNGGEGYDLPVEYDYAYEFYLPTSADVHYAGFIFGGWFDDPGFDEGPVTVIPAHSAEARTFYAKWYGGTPCGENLYYAVDEQHVLMIVIQGADTQAMYDNDGTHTWWDTDIIGVSLPEGLLNIGSNAFKDCVLVTGIEIPPTVTEIRLDAFKGCTGLKEQVALERTVALDLGQGAFHTDAATRLFVTGASMVKGDGTSSCAVLVIGGYEYHVVFGHVAVDAAWSTSPVPSPATLAVVFAVAGTYYAVPYDSFASTVLVYSVTTTGSYTTGPTPGAVSLAAALGPSPLPDRSADPQALRSRAGLREDEVVPEQEEQPQEQEEVSP